MEVPRRANSAKLAVDRVGPFLVGVSASTLSVDLESRFMVPLS